MLKLDAAVGPAKTGHCVRDGVGARPTNSSMIDVTGTTPAP